MNQPPIVAVDAPPAIPIEWCRGEYRPQFLQGALLHEQFDAVAADRPDAVCLVDDATGVSLMYREVAEAVDTLAAALAKLGVTRDIAVGILVDRSPAVVIGMFGVLKSGGAYVPLDPSYQSDRLSGYLADAATPVLITQSALATKARDLAAAAAAETGRAPPTIILMEDIMDSAASGGSKKKPAAPAIQLSDHDLAYCMFTSGSTGRPKGVEISHGGLRDLIAFFVEKMELGPDDVFCLNTTVCFDPYVLYLYGCLVVGGCLVIPKPEGHVDPAYMANLCRDHGITILEVVPSLATQYVRDLAPLGQAGQMRIRRFLTGGEALSVALANSVYDALPNCEMVWNTYGPTEVTVQVITGAIPRGADRVPLGRPDHNVHCYISTYPGEDGEPEGEKFVPRMCGVGEPGELLLSGPRLGRGYRGRPDLTADKFVPNPFYDTTADLPPEIRLHYQKVYHTGDLVRWGADGQLEFLGRIDRQVKVNGVRIELAEIEAALAATPGVARAAAVAWKDQRTGNYRLAGYVVPDVGKGDEVAHEARDLCASRLVPAMVPTVVLPLEDIRLLPNGKADLKSLPEPDWNAIAAARIYTAPADELEAALARIWKEALGATGGDQGIGTADDFFELGGNSLLAGRINSDVRKELGIDIPSLVIFQSRTIAGMAKHIRPMVHRKGGKSREIGDGGSDDGHGAGSDAGYSPAHGGVVKGKAFPIWFCGFLQLIGFIISHLLEFAITLAPAFALLSLYSYTKFQLGPVLVLMSPIMFLLYFGLMILTILLKWIILWRLKPGTYALWGWQYVRWWTMRAVYGQLASIVLPLFKGSEILNIFFRCMGAKIGKRVMMESITVGDWDLITIGDDTVVEGNCFINASSVAAGDTEGEPGTITFAPVKIGRDCTLGSQTSVGPGTDLPDGGVVKPSTATTYPKSLLEMTEPINGNELRTAHKPLPFLLQLFASFIMTTIFTMAWLGAAVPVAFLWRELVGLEWIDLFKGAMRCWATIGVRAESWNVITLETNSTTGITTSIVTPTSCTDIYVGEVISITIFPTALFLAGQVYLVVVLLLKWVLVGRMTSEKCRRTDLLWRFNSHLWKMLMDLPMYRTASDPWTGTAAFNTYLRLQGAKVGKQAWLGEKFVCSEPDQLTIGDYVSVCSAVTVVCSTEARSQPVELKSSCAVTNENVLLPGTVVYPEAVLGVYSVGRPGAQVPPHSITQGEVVLVPGKDLESAAELEDPKAANPKAVSAWIYWRSNVLYWMGTLFFVPLTASMHELPMIICLLTGLYYGGPLLALAALPVGSILANLILLIYMALVKLLLLPNSNGAHPLYGFRAGAWQLLCILGYIYDDFRPIMGSPMFNWYLRSMGAKVGKGVCALGCNCAELDMVTIGDGCVINEQAFLMGHTVENRAVKMGWVTLGKRVTIGSCSAVLPGAVLEDGCVLGDMSLVMKNDTVPAGSVWAGIPAVPIGTTKNGSDKLSDSCKLSDSAKTASEVLSDS